MTHATLKTQVLVALSERGIMAWNNPTGVAIPLGSTAPVRYGLTGAPDVIGILPGGRFLAVEVKVGRDRVRPEQARWHARARELGALVLVLRETDELSNMLG